MVRYMDKNAIPSRLAFLYFVRAIELILLVSKLTYGQSNFFVVGGHVVLCCVMYSVEYLSLEMFRNNDN